MLSGAVLEVKRRSKETLIQSQSQILHGFLYTASSSSSLNSSKERLRDSKSMKRDIP